MSAFAAGLVATGIVVILLAVSVDLHAIKRRLGRLEAGIRIKGEDRP